MARVWCSDHCRSCGSHFSSTTAFDAHRAGTHEPPERHCIEPEDVKTVKGARKLEAVQGGCRIGPNVCAPQTDVAVWRKRLTAKDRERLSALKAQRLTPSEGST